MKVSIIVICSLLGSFLVIKGFFKNIQEIRLKGAHTSSDKYFNYPLMVLWYAYLLAFSVGLIINNLIVK